MRTITIEVPEPGDDKLVVSLDVVLPDGRRCGGLCWGEMIEQVTGLTFAPEAPVERYLMQSTADWAKQYPGRFHGVGNAGALDALEACDEHAAGGIHTI